MDNFVDYLASIKNLYRLSVIELEVLLEKIKIEFSNNETDNYLQLVKTHTGQLLKDQTLLKNKIPNDKYNNVNNFIINLVHNNNIFEEKINSVKNIDPYKLYGFDKNKKFTLEELKQKYKEYARDTHPDRNNGSTKNFQIIQEAYKKLYNDYKLKEEDRQFTDLKNNSQDYINNQLQKRNINFDQNNFDVNKFNNIFSENKVEDLNEDGYGSWIKDNSYENESIKKNSKLNGGFSINNFNDVFENDIKVSNSVVKYSKPKELFMNEENNCVELGKKIDNFTGQTKNIQFTDYKEAHTTNRLVDNNMEYKSYNNINELEHSRSVIKPLTMEEIQHTENQKNLEQIQEEKRNQNLRLLDDAHFRNYNKVNKMMLG